MIRLARYIDLLNIRKFWTESAIDCEQYTAIQFAFLFMRKCIYVYTDKNNQILGLISIDPDDPSHVTNLLAVKGTTQKHILLTLLNYIASLPENKNNNCLTIFTDSINYNTLIDSGATLVESSYCIKPMPWDRIPCIRKANTQDLETVLRLRKDCLAESQESFDETQLRWETERDLADTYLVDINDQVHGFLICLPHKTLQRCKEIDDIYLTPDFRGRNYERALIATAFSDAATQKADLVFVRVSANQGQLLNIIKEINMECSSVNLNYSNSTQSACTSLFST